MGIVVGCVIDVELVEPPVARWPQCQSESELGIPSMGTKSLGARGMEGPRVYLDSILFGFSAWLGRVALGRRQYTDLLLQNLCLFSTARLYTVWNTIEYQKSNRDLLLV